MCKIIALKERQNSTLSEAKPKINYLHKIPNLLQSLLLQSEQICERPSAQTERWNEKETGPKPGLLSMY